MLRYLQINRQQIYTDKSTKLFSGQYIGTRDQTHDTANVTSYLGMIQQLRNPFLRQFSLGIPPLFHCIIFWLTSRWCFKDYVILERVNDKNFNPKTHLYQEPADGYIGSFFYIAQGNLPQK